MLHALARTRDNQARDRAVSQGAIGLARRGVPQGWNAQRGERVVPKKKTEQVQEIGDAVVDRGGGH